MSFLIQGCTFYSACYVSKILIIDIILYRYYIYSLLYIYIYFVKKIYLYYLLFIFVCFIMYSTLSNLYFISFTSISFFFTCITLSLSLTFFFLSVYHKRAMLLIKHFLAYSKFSVSRGIIHL